MYASKISRTQTIRAEIQETVCFKRYGVISTFWLCAKSFLFFPFSRPSATPKAGDRTLSHFLSALSALKASKGRAKKHSGSMYWSVEFLAKLIARERATERVPAFPNYAIPR